MFSGFLCKKENDFLISLSPCGKNLSFYTKLFSYTHQHLVRMMAQPLVFSSPMPLPFDSRHRRSFQSSPSRPVEICLPSPVSQMHSSPNAGNWHRFKDSSKPLSVLEIPKV